MATIDNSISMTSCQDLSAANCGWGFGRFFDLNTIKAKARMFREEQEAIERNPSDPPRPPEPFKICGRFTIRFISLQVWMARSDDMVAHPAKYLYLNNLRSMVAQVYPPTPSKKITLESVMKSMLENAGSDNGVVTFKVGPEGTPFLANSCIIQSRIGVPLLREGLAESRDKEVTLPHIRAKVFKIFLQFLYTQRISDTEMKWAARELFVLADQYNVPDLRFMTENYLCFVTQVTYCILDNSNAFLEFA
jgi:hypothetical protein